uniref:Transmembrane protein 51b n=1 Tax=Amphiprion percula TaxID=161767 RepID=A0A3P8S079_AMPPE
MCESSSESGGSGAHYALCALGVGLIALAFTSTASSGNSSTVPGTDDHNDGEDTDHTKSSSVAMVLVGVGAAMLLLSICIGVRTRGELATETARPSIAFFSRTVDPTSYNVPSYEEVVGSGDYPVRQSNLRQSISQLPSYEDIIAAVENEGPQPDPAAALVPNPSLPTRSSSRASRLLRPLRVRRIKSDKLHLKDFRLQIRSPTQNPVTIEPITPPPQYDNKMPELQ